MIFGELNAAVGLVEKVWKWAVRRGPKDTVATRFVRLFEAHGVHRNQIPRFLGHDLRPTSLQSDEALMEVLTEELLERAASRFAIRREWLDGASDVIYPLRDFYKAPEVFVDFIRTLQAQESGAVRGVVLASASSRFEETGLLVLEQEIGGIGGKPIYRYHLCNNWFFEYWKSRAYLTACVAHAWKSQVYVIGRRVPVRLVRAYREGKTSLKYGYDTALPTSGAVWYPEDMALKPAAFLKGLGEGEDGVREGLSLWLQLEAQGLMETRLPYVNVRATFERALESEFA